MNLSANYIILYLSFLFYYISITLLLLLLLLLLPYLMIRLILPYPILSYLSRAKGEIELG